MRTLNSASGSPFETEIGFSRAVRIEDVIAVAGTAPIQPNGETAFPGSAYEQTRLCSLIGLQAAENIDGKICEIIFISPAILLLLQILTLHVFAQSPSQSDNPKIMRGEMIEKVIIQNKPEQSYAAYLPGNYNVQKKIAIIFCFDPLARGKFAVEHFWEAAEKYGFIVVCSNNLRNGLELSELQESAAAFLKDAEERFDVDEKRKYFAGFSGGARLAVGLALSCQGCVAGVIAIGAGFPPGSKPSAKNQFIYYGAAGIDDFNFGEMRGLEKSFSETPSAIYKFQTFAGGHEWMDEKTAEDALAWLNLQAMKNGTLAKDEKIIAEHYNLRKVEAARLFSENRFVDAYRNNLSLIRDFENLYDVKALKEAAEKLKNSAQLKREINAESELINRQARESGEILALQYKMSDISEEKIEPRIQLQNKLAALRKKSLEKTDSDERRLARRILFGLFVGAIETAKFHLRRKNYSQAISQFEFALLIDPENANVAYETASAYALDKRNKKALELLEKAVDLGFKDFEKLKADKAFTAISQESRFQKLLLEKK